MFGLRARARPAMAHPHAAVPVRLWSRRVLLVSALVVCVVLPAVPVHSAAVATSAASPCPAIFKYATDSVKQQIYGIVDTRDQPVDKAGTLELHLSIAGELRSKYVGSIEAIEDSTQILEQFGKGRGVQYRVNFPLQDPLPKITKVVFNGRELCTGPGDRGSFVSAVTLRHFLRSDSCKENCAGTRVVPASLNLGLSPPTTPRPAAPPAVAPTAAPAVSAAVVPFRTQATLPVVGQPGGGAGDVSGAGAPGVQHEYQRTIERKEETNNPQDNSTSVKYIREEITYRKQVITPGGATTLQDDQLQLPSFVTN